MGKRSDFPRRARDDYRTTDPRAFPPLAPHWQESRRMPSRVVVTRPSARSKPLGLRCTYFSDLPDGDDALDLTAERLNGAEVVITNPPWSRAVLHPMIEHFQRLKPTFLLFDADWAHTRQSAPISR